MSVKIVVAFSLLVCFSVKTYAGSGQLKVRLWLIYQTLTASVEHLPEGFYMTLQDIAMRNRNANSFMRNIVACYEERRVPNTNFIEIIRVASEESIDGATALLDSTIEFNCSF